MDPGSIKWNYGSACLDGGSWSEAISLRWQISRRDCSGMSKTITGAMPIRTVGLTPGHRWCGGHRSVKPAVNNGKGAPGLVHGPNSLNATYIRPGHISDRPRKLAKDLRNGHQRPLPSTTSVTSVQWPYVLEWLGSFSAETQEVFVSIRLNQT